MRAAKKKNERKKNEKQKIVVCAPIEIDETIRDGWRFSHLPAEEIELNSQLCLICIK